MQTKELDPGSFISQNKYWTNLHYLLRIILIIVNSYLVIT